MKPRAPVTRAFVMVSKILHSVLGASRPHPLRGSARPPEDQPAAITIPMGTTLCLVLDRRVIQNDRGDCRMIAYTKRYNKDWSERGGSKVNPFNILVGRYSKGS